MNANELRIGNFVEYNLSSGAFDYETELKPMKITGISSADWMHNFVLLDDGYNNSYDFDEIKGIYLTEEWLINFGFEKDEFHMLSWYEKDCVDIYIEEDGTFKNYGKAKVDYVHQLQNLYFALTGKELEYKP